jgi:hypothetical protein
VSRTNISILLATALLGVLLWIIISMVWDLSRAPAIPLPLPVVPEIVELDSSLPRIGSTAELRVWLSTNGHAADILISGYCDWLGARGFAQLAVLHEQCSDQSPGNYSTLDYSNQDYSTQDDASLLVYAASGDLGALHELAERSLTDDPLAALDWYDQAIVNGSIFAMQRVADLLATLGDPELAVFTSDSAWRAALDELNNAAAAPLERALAWSIAAVTVGGYGILDQAHAERIGALSSKLDIAAVQRACGLAQEYVLSTAAARRARGGAVFAMEPPTMALSVAQPDAVLNCDVHISPLVALTECEQQDFYTADLRRNTLWLCRETE